MGCKNLAYGVEQQNFRVVQGKYVSLEKVVGKATYYYPFGMAIEERTWSSNTYRYSFGGKEKQPETEYFDFDARNYDARTCRWLAIDPKSSNYASTSPYVGFGNSPIFFTDPGGETLRVAHVNDAEALADINLVAGKFASALVFNAQTSTYSVDWNAARGTMNDRKFNKFIEEGHGNIAIKMANSHLTYGYATEGPATVINRDNNNEIRELPFARMPAGIIWDNSGPGLSSSQAFLNMSITPYSATTQGLNPQPSGYSGLVLVAPGTMYYNEQVPVYENQLIDERNTRVQVGTRTEEKAMSRKDFVTHELEENYNRTQGGANQEGMSYEASHNAAGGGPGTKFDNTTRFITR